MKFRRRGRSKLHKSKPSKFLRVVDDTGVGDPKRVVVFFKNTATEGGDEEAWFDATMRDGDKLRAYWDAPIYIDASRQSSPAFDYPQVTAVNGNAYDTDGEELVISSAVPNEFSVRNNEEEDLSVDVSRSGGPLARVVISGGDSYTFSYRSTVWVMATDDLDEEIDFSEANTEISLFGIRSADIVVGASEDMYTFSLSNIVVA